jgi:hypothetical protein
VLIDDGGGLLVYYLICEGSLPILFPAAHAYNKLGQRDETEIKRMTNFWQKGKITPPNKVQTKK